MPSLALLKTVLREVLARDGVERVPEPDLVMDDPEKVVAYTRAGREDGVMAPVYLFHCAQICEVIRPGDTVLDLGCGPATQLAMVARLNPDVHFIGIDLSDEMLAKAREHVTAEGLGNVTLHRGDITDLRDFPDGSADAVMSTVVLHHLPDVPALERVFAEVARVLKPDGGLYLVDFGRLKSAKSIEYFAYQYADRQPELFTLDYLYSLRAAFSRSDFERLAARYLGSRARVYAMFLLPYMVAVKSSARRVKDANIQRKLRSVRERLPHHHQRDFNDLARFFRTGGMASCYVS